MAFFPNDPLFPDQWYLRNRGQALSTGQPGGRVGEDINVLPAWNLGLTGQGVLMAFVDDGVEIGHPDLAPNYRAAFSYDFNDEDSTPQARQANEDWHGTSVAGIAAGRGGNGGGITGIAPYASFAALRLTAADTTDEQEARALNYRFQAIAIYNNSWGPPDRAQLQAPGPLLRAALSRGVTYGRGGLGSIYVWAAGNGREQEDNANFDGYTNSRYVISVAALDHKGQFSPYSEPGACILVSAYGDDYITGIATTDLLGNSGYNPDIGFSTAPNYSNHNYTNNFNGTSAATPMVSGVVALMLQANPNLTWRDVQHILVQTARQNDPANEDWQLNGAGHLINHNYGFGVVNAGAAVQRAQTWQRVAREVSFRSPVLLENRSIFDNGTALSSTFTLEDNVRIERVELVFDADHAQSSDLQIELFSPDGTPSILAPAGFRPNQGTYNNWAFTSTRHWDEQAAGTWTLQVRDQMSLNEGVWNSWQLRVYGTRTFLATDRADTLRGSARIDAIAGKEGNDILYGLAGRDRLLGGTGADTLSGGLGGDRLYGSFSTDILSGGDGNDSLYGEQGNDKLRGGNGHDLLVGSTGADTLVGGAGADIFKLERFLSPDRILDFADGIDRLGISPTLQTANFSFTDQSNGTMIRLGGQKLAFLVGIQSSQISGADFTAYSPST
ncbi:MULTISPECIES: S8 family serine peptidase [unclassified Leptolyngbya]|uniref:S8 family serine peptidase n=1 Tax=unclassified Leptolyngbya TaxID=2650499 RepID=UPI0016820434|nr:MULTISPECIES: S8 family serine peptidase [unclassified Leptolyngbya]MBD1909545.1 S8 family serine peptidase [Leptolyngbya sp. FACHB-8]MBD2154083.1 S8 family serine peptidase [Leptolyngbya sp. FACHB-16]